MSIFQDNFDSLSELERLAAMAHDPVRIHEIGQEQWPLAMMACGLMASNDEEKQAENLDIYPVFAEKTSVASRRGSMQMLCRFIASRKGEGWKSLLPYILCEPAPEVASKAALHLVTLAQPAPDTPLSGVQELVRCIKDDDALDNAPMLNTLLSLADMRAMPLLQPLCALPQERLEDLLDAISIPANHLACQWLLSALESCPAAAQHVADALCRIMPAAPTILDVALPIPFWAFDKPQPQPLHGWSREEYFPRMLTELQKHLSAEQIDAVRTACGPA